MREVEIFSKIFVREGEVAPGVSNPVDPFGWYGGWLLGMASRPMGPIAVAR